MEFKIPENPVIISIEDDFDDNYNTGLKICTDKGVIMILIDMEAACCEETGHNFIDTPDDITTFIGAKIQKIEAIEIDNSDSEDARDYEDKEVQLKVTTDKGVLQYAVYNSHNGYYSHTSFVQVFDTTMESTL